MSTHVYVLQRLKALGDRENDIILYLFMSTHVYVLQRLKALGDRENEAKILHWTLWESALNAYFSEVQRPITPIFTL